LTLCISYSGLYISYVIPISLAGFDQAHFRTLRGPFHLGALSRPVALISTAYVIFITVVFCLPTANPGALPSSLQKLVRSQVDLPKLTPTRLCPPLAVDINTLNYAPVAVGIVIVWIFVSWFCGMRRVFRAPSQGASSSFSFSFSLTSPSSPLLTHRRIGSLADSSMAAPTKVSRFSDEKADEEVKDEPAGGSIAQVITR